MRVKRKSVAQLKRKLLPIFSKYIRMRDGLRTTGSTEYALCITCGKRIHFARLNAGHFVPGRHNANLFSERGCHAQCVYCNKYLHGNVLGYRRQIIKLYGGGVDIELENEARQVKKFTVPELEKVIEHYKKKIEIMEGK